MNPSLIRWTKDDKQNLRRVVNNFNNKIKRLEAQGKSNLPQKVSYKELVGLKDLQEGEIDRQIYSRKELNRTIKSLQRFSKRGAENLVTLKSGAKLTNWEYSEFKNQKRIAIGKMNKEINFIKSTDGWHYGFGEKQAGDLELSINSLRDLENRKGYDLRLTLERAKWRARDDNQIRKGKVWYDNYIQSVEYMVGEFENADLLLSKLKTFKNPLNAYDLISKDSILQEVFKYYKEKSTSQLFAGYADTQEAFNVALKNIGIL